MIAAAHVRAARVFDVRTGKPQPEALVLDANVLFFVHYPSFGTLAAVGGEPPSVYRTREYGAALKRALRAKTRLFTSATTLLEFAHIVEKVELEISWRKAGGQGAFEYKQVREQLAAQLEEIRKTVLVYVSAVRKITTIIEALHAEGTLAVWRGSCGDTSDSALAAAALREGVPDLLSDDADFLTYRDLHLFTANQAAIDLAKSVGRLG